jgi:hypothetical protein
MNGLKAIAAVTLILMIPGLTSAQSLVEAAKKEKERREKLKGKTAIVVTNADLAKTSKKPAVVTPQQSEQSPPPIAAPPEPSGTSVPGSQFKAAAAARAEARKQFEARKADLENAWATAKDEVDLLTLKMRSLWQQFYTFNSMTTKDSVQREISDTSQKLQAAQAKEIKAKEELVRFTAAGVKGATSPIKIE